jgi:hypothetical protein
MQNLGPIIVAGLSRCAFVALLLWSCAAPLAGSAFTDRIAQVTPANLDATAAYRRQLEAYTTAREAFDDASTAYWTTIAEKRNIRNAKRRAGQQVLLEDYVLTQPPVYAGPPKPVNPSAPPETAPSGNKVSPYNFVPVVTDFLQAAAEQYKFMPQRPRSELEYKRAYARVAAASGLTKEQIVRVYGFESGGNGAYDVQAGLEYPRPNAHAITTALGYNQLLHVNSVELMAEKGDKFIKALKAKVAQASDKTDLEQKIAVLQRMVAFGRTVPDSWSEHEKLANTPPGLGIHAMVLDIDVGPLLQTQKLLDSVEFARRKGHTLPLTAAELEMMNLTGDGNGFDMVMMPATMRVQVPTANFFQQASYARNSVAVRNNVVATLIAATDETMDREVKLQGAKDLAAAFPK